MTRPCLVLLLLLLGSAPAQGQAKPAEAPSEEEISLARSLFYAGLELADRADWQAAAEHFQKVLSIRDSAVVSYHLANANVELGRCVAARPLVERVLADAETTEEVRIAAERLKPRIEEGIGELTVQLNGSLEGVALHVNGEPLNTTFLGVPMPMDIGEATVTVLRDEQTLVERTAQVGGAADRQVKVTIDVPPREPPPSLAALPAKGPASQEQASPGPVRAAPAAALASDEPRDGEGGGIHTKWWFWTAIGVAATGAIVAVAVATDSAEPADVSSVQGDFMPGILEGKVGP